LVLTTKSRPYEALGDAARRRKRRRHAETEDDAIVVVIIVVVVVVEDFRRVFVGDVVEAVVGGTGRVWRDMLAVFLN